MKGLTLASLALAAFAAGCAASDPLASHPSNVEIQREVTMIIKRVKEETGAALFDDLKRLVAYDVFSVRQTCELAEDPNARLRSNAFWVLAQIQDPEHPELMEQIDRTLRDGLDDVEPTARFEAAAGLAARGKWEVVPVLIEGLESRESGIRYRCNEQLIATTSRDFGYATDAPAESRENAVARWRAWYADWQKSRS